MPTALVVDEPPTPDETKLTAEFIEFLKRTSASRPPGKNGEVLRFNQGRATGCVEAELTVPADLPERLRVGFFAVPRTYQAIVRFANATSATDRDRDTRGMTIGVFDVPGTNLTSRPDPAGLRAQQPSGHAGAGCARVHGTAQGQRVRAAAGACTSPPTSMPRGSRWRHARITAATSTFRTGAPRRMRSATASVVKYMTRPTSARVSTLPDRRTDNYLRDALRAHLAAAEASFDLDGPVLRGRCQDPDRERDGGVDEGGLALAHGGSDQDSAAVGRRSGPHQPVRADGVQPLACPRRASSARRHEPGAAGDLPGVERVPADRAIVASHAPASRHRCSPRWPRLSRRSVCATAAAASGRLFAGAGRRTARRPALPARGRLGAALERPRSVRMEGV